VLACRHNVQPNALSSPCGSPAKNCSSASSSCTNVYSHAFETNHVATPTVNLTASLPIVSRTTQFPAFALPSLPFQPLSAPTCHPWPAFAPLLAPTFRLFLALAPTLSFIPSFLFSQLSLVRFQFPQPMVSWPSKTSSSCAPRPMERFSNLQLARYLNHLSPSTFLYTASPFSPLLAPCIAFPPSVPFSFCGFSAILSSTLPLNLLRLSVPLMNRLHPLSKPFPSLCFHRAPFTTVLALNASPVTTLPLPCCPHPAEADLFPFLSFPLSPEGFAPMIAFSAASQSSLRQEHTHQLLQWRAEYLLIIVQTAAAFDRYLLLLLLLGSCFLGLKLRSKRSRPCVVFV